MSETKRYKDVCQRDSGDSSSRKAEFEEFKQHVTAFLDDFITYGVGAIYWPERASVFADPEAYLTQPNEVEANPHRKPLGLLVLEAAHETYSERRWDNGKIGIDEAATLLDTVAYLVDTPHIQMSGAWSRDVLLPVIDVARAYVRYEEEYDLTIGEVAILANMKEGSVRNALYAEGEDKLSINSDGYIPAREAKRWLLLRRGFRPMELYDSRYVLSNDKIHFRTIRDVTHLIRERLGVMDINPVFLRKLFSDYDFNDDALKFFSNEAPASSYLDFLPSLSDALLDPIFCMRLAKILLLDRDWFTERAVELAAKEQADRLIDEAKRRAEKALKEAGVVGVVDTSIQYQGDAKPTDKLVRAAIAQCKFCHPHPQYKPGNKKMEGYQTDDGTAFTHEYNLKQQSLWFPMVALPDSLSDIKSTTYLSTDLWKQDNYGRHSGLKTYPELENADLVKFQPRTMREVERIIECICTPTQ